MLEEATIAELIAPYITMLIGLIISLSIKDIITNFIKGIGFKLNPLFKPGDTIFVDGEYSVVVKVGIRYSVFGSTKDNGDYVWRSVLNERVAHLKIEKIVIPKEHRRKKTDKTPKNPVDTSE